MKKLIIPMMAAAFTATTLLMPVSNVSAYDNGPHGGYEHGQHGKPEYGGPQPGGQNGENHAEQGAQKQLHSIDKQLMKVEQLIAKYNAKFDKMDRDRYKDKKEDKDDDDEKDTDKGIDKNKEGTDQQEDENKDQNKDGDASKEAGQQPDQDAPQDKIQTEPAPPVTAQSASADPNADTGNQRESDNKPYGLSKEQEKAEKEQAKRDKEQAEKEKEEAEEAAEKEKEAAEEAAEKEKEAAEEAAEEAKEKEEDLAEELEEAVEEHNEYTGKFTSLNHRLDGIVRQLDSLATRIPDSTELAARYEKVETLRGQLQASTDKINGIQQEVIDKIAAEKDAIVKPEAPVSDVMKPWHIHFSKPLDEQAISELNVVVVDSQNNLIATNTTYDAASRSIVITPQQAYKIGEKYTLFIDKEIKSHSGKTLKKSIKKTFYIH